MAFLHICLHLCKFYQPVFLRFLLPKAHLQLSSHHSYKHLQMEPACGFLLLKPVYLLPEIDKYACCKYSFLLMHQRSFAIQYPYPVPPLPFLPVPVKCIVLLLLHFQEPAASLRRLHDYLDL